ncbi:putative hexokinase HKDC1 [Thelohanellus kitauei]|uniref:Phosphotransferase n=1 Tax=Thelohanellus kitauei TaxID=669202 RepID=A0A0C2JBE6_THEKT|nr:putative hexokinase HKDC1 [Thelohanellus kitauei]
MAQKIAQGFERLKINHPDVKFMGFTFSFPCLQTQLNNGTLIKWTKGYSASDVENHNVVEMLRKACAERGLRIGDFVLTNDTVGTLLYGAYQYPGCSIAVINGTGTNACYIEKTENVNGMENPNGHQTVIINTEWGSFGENGELDKYRLKVDRDVDNASINTGFQTFEKMVSGLYIGEIIRRTIIQAHDQRLIFIDRLPEGLEKENSFPSTWSSKVHNNDWLINKFKKKFSYVLDDRQCDQIVKICDAITMRAARLCAAGLSALVIKTGNYTSPVAADGSLFQRHPHFLGEVQNCLNTTLLENTNVRIERISEGSGIGAALAACIVTNHPELIPNPTPLP